MKERDFLNWVLDVAKQTGWHVWHVPAPMKAGRKGEWVPAREAAGLPDLIMIHEDPPTLIFAELKGTSGRLTAAQADFLRLAHIVGWSYGEKPKKDIGAYLWKPGDEEMVETILKTRVLA
jgi:hypothetical protein